MTLLKQELNMFGVFQFALVVLFVGCSTLASPFERKQRNAGPQVEVTKQGHPPCGQKTKISDVVKVSMATFAEYGGQVMKSSSQMQIEFELGETPILEGFDEALVGMCPGEVRRLKYAMNEGQGYNGPYIIYEVVLESIKTGSGPLALLPPEMDTNGDNTLNRDELSNYLSTIIGEYLPVGSPLYEQTIDGMFSMLDTNYDGVIDFDEAQKAADLSSIGSFGSVISP